MAARYALAKKKAKELLAAENVRSFKVPVERIAQKYGKAMIKYVPFDGQLSGMAQIRDDGTAIIGVNEKHVEVRRRFTIAHELGHLILHNNKKFHIDNFIIGRRDESSGLAIDDNEIEANQFAAELLMPVDLLKGALDGIDLDSPVDMINLAKRIGVSHQALTIRLSRLNFVG